MGLVGMDIAQIESDLVKLENGAVKLDELTENVGKLQEPLMECWKGQEAEAAGDLIASVSQKMTQMSEEVRKIYNWVDGLKKGYEEAAEKGAGAYQSAQ